MTSGTIDLVAIRLAQPARPRPNKWLVTISITFGTLMGAILS